MRTHFVKALAVLLLLIPATACAASSGGAGPGTSASASRPPTVSNDWALQYTGGTGGKAEPSNTPLVIGYINQEGGVPAFPEATQGIDAATAYVNAELGGAGGLPVKIDKCIVQTDQDGQRCADQMANDPQIKFVLLGQLTVGNKAIYATLAGKKPTLQASPGTVDDLTARDSYAYTPGGPGLIAGLAVFIAQHLKNVHRVAVVYANNPAGKASVEQFFKPLLAHMGISDVTPVAADDNATGPALASAVQAAGAAKADVLVSFLTAPGCIAIYDALRTLQLHPTVVATGLCFDTSMQQHLKDVGAAGQVPDWYYGAFGVSYFQPDAASGMTTYLPKIMQYGPPNVNYTGFAGYTFADLMTAVKFVNEIGFDKLTSEVFREKAGTFSGPAMLTPGPMKCGFDPAFPPLCGSRVGVEQYTDQHWIPTALGDNAINIQPALGG